MLANLGCLFSNYLVFSTGIISVSASGSGDVLTAVQHTLMTAVNMKAFVSLVASVESGYPDNCSSDNLEELYQPRLLLSMQKFFIVALKYVFVLWQTCIIEKIKKTHPR